MVRPQHDSEGVTGQGPVPSPWVPGARFSTYEIESRLASGGMAEIWRAKMMGLEGFERRIVIKTMLTNLHHRPELVEMFVSEASLAARLSHPNIVDVFDFGQQEGRYFIAMAFVPGVTLRFAHKRTVARGRRLPVVAVLHVMRDVCEALQYMHELEDGEGPLDLIHRDLSPDNVILSTSGAAKLIDFGAARATARTPPARVFVGKYRYAAPERIRQQGEDARSDVYSAGVVLYECLTGVRPFEGPDAEVIQAIVSSRCCDPRIQVPSLPDSVADLVCKATAGNPADRFASARELGTALAHCLAELKASSKERDVTLALTAVLEEVPAAAPAAREPPEADAVPEAIEAQSSLPTARLDIEDALCEVEILEASGPIRKPVEAVNDDDTVPVRLLPEPAEAVPVASSLAELNSEAVHGATPTVSIFDRGGERRLVAPSDDSTASEEESSIQRAVDLFDRGLELRAQGRYGEALDAWERALSLAPENQVYQSNVRRLREQLHQLRTEGDELAADTQRYDLEDAG